MWNRENIQPDDQEIADMENSEKVIVDCCGKKIRSERTHVVDGVFVWCSPCWEKVFLTE